MEAGLGKENCASSTDTNWTKRTSIMQSITKQLFSILLIDNEIVYMLLLCVYCSDGLFVFNFVVMCMAVHGVIVYIFISFSWAILNRWCTFLCCCVQEAFSAAKMAFRQFKMKTRANLAKTHHGPDTLEEAVQDYINRNTDLVDTPGIVSVSCC